MFKAVSALQGAVFNDGIAEVRELGLRGMITLRGDLADKKLIKAVKAIAGAMPDARAVALKGDDGAAWMSTDELLIMVPHADVLSTIASLEKSLSGTHFLVANVSDARAVFEVSGPKAREVMAKLAPVDFAPDAFTAEMFRRSRLAQVPAAFWMNEEDAFTVVCFRSVGEYMFDLLSVAAQQGSEVEVY